ncbi:MAG: SDR family NAD(P)-dependent oxidoreductase [Streptosporangiales bacterium]|nr:SDR family NAD(P)-dependent oxidoreductase [Streptosporangiales bacterium]
MPAELAGKVALVTGGSRGLGAEMVRAFAAEGAHVAIASRKLSSCEELAAEVRERHGVRALPVACNVSHWDECDALAESVYAEFGRVDVLVNNAGLSPLYPSLDQVSEDLFDKVIGVNLRGPFRLTALIGTRMASGGGGTIINIGSIEAIRPQPHALPYAAAKAGLHVLSEGFAKAFGPTVRVNTIQAGPFLTDISAHWSEGARARLESSTALERCGDPSEVVGAALFFATSASSYASGAVLRLDGGHA